MSDGGVDNAVPYRASLAARLVLVMGGLIVGTALVLSALTIYLLSAEQERVTQTRLTTAKGLADTIIDEQVSAVARVARAAALDSAVRDAANRRDAAAAAAALERYQAVAPDAALTLSDVGYTVLVGPPPSAPRLHDALGIATANGGITAGVAATDRCEIVTVAVMPVQAGDAVVGAVMVTSPLNPEFVDRLRTTTRLNAWTYCGDTASGVITGANAVQIDLSTRTAVLGSLRVVLGASRADGVEVYGYYVPLIDVRRQAFGMYGVTQPVAEIAAAREEAIRLFASAAIALAALVLLEAYVLARVIIRPMRALTRATQAMAAGDLSTPVEAAGRDEIGVLARSVETMRVRLARMYADLELERNRYRDFLAMVPHEFKTPLAAMSASLELLEVDEEVLAPHQRGLLASVRRSVLRLQQLIENLLDSASIQAGQFQVRAKPADLRVILAEAQASVQPLIDQRKQQLHIDVPDTLPQVLADPKRVTQVLVNLLSNANKYSPTGQSIEVCAATDADFVRVTVSDQGPGIAPEQQPQLFQRFARLGAAGTDQPTGIGLGLAMVSEIIRLHGGQVGVSATTGGGASFWFTLPVTHPEGRLPLD